MRWAEHEVAMRCMGASWRGSEEVVGVARAASGRGGASLRRQGVGTGGRPARRGPAAAGRRRRLCRRRLGDAFGLGHEGAGAVPAGEADGVVEKARRPAGLPPGRDASKLPIRLARLPSPKVGVGAPGRAGRGGWRGAGRRRCRGRRGGRSARPRRQRPSRRGDVVGGQLKGAVGPGEGGAEARVARFEAVRAWSRPRW